MVQDISIITSKNWQDIVNTTSQLLHIDHVIFAKKYDGKLKVHLANAKVYNKANLENILHFLNKFKGESEDISIKKHELHLNFYKKQEETQFYELIKTYPILDTNMRIYGFLILLNKKEIKIDSIGENLIQLQIKTIEKDILTENYINNYALELDTLFYEQNKQLTANNNKLKQQITKLLQSENKLITTNKTLFETTQSLKAKEESLQLQYKQLSETNLALTKAKNKYKQNEQLLSNIAANYPNSCVCVVNSYNYIIFSSGQAFKEQFKINSKNGLSINEAFSENAHEVLKHIKKSFNGENCSFEVKQNGIFQSVKIVPFNENHNKIRKVLIVVEDITKRKEYEREIIKSNYRLNEAQSIAQMGHWEYDLIKNELYWSDEVYNIFGFVPQEIKASFEIFLELVHPDDRKLVQESFNNHIKEKQIYDITHKIVLLNGEVKHVNEKCYTEYDKNGKAIRSIGTVADITHHIKINEELRAAKEKAEESDRLKTEFFHNLSHEVRTPLNGIVGFTSLLIEAKINENKAKEFTNIIYESSNQLTTIIDDILEVSKLETNQVKPQNDTVDLNKLFNELYNIYKLKTNELGISLYKKTEFHDSLCSIYTDYNKLFKILTNLLNNAVKYTPKGFIEFGYNLVQMNDSNFITFYVKDTGIGIKKNMHETIFKKFSQEEKELTRNVGGLGLGLAIAKKLAELIEGNITLSSVKGEGSTFNLTIPYRPSRSYEKDEAITQKRKTSLNKYLENVSILIAEDQISNFKYLKEFIISEIGHSCNILHAKNGQEAVDLCNSNEFINIVLMDLKMPVMDGFDATRLILKTKPNLPIIAQTAYYHENDKEMALTAGCKEIITKPANVQTLKSVIFKYLTK